MDYLTGRGRSDFLKTEEEKKLEKRLQELREIREKKYLKLIDEQQKKNEKIIEENRKRRKKEEDN